VRALTVPHYRYESLKAHTTHSKLGPRLKIVALIDPNVERAKAVLKMKCETFVRPAYENTGVYRSLDDFIQQMTPNQAPRVFVVGSPPMFRGTQRPGRDIETQIVKSFPGVALFVEKPVATGPASEIEEAFKVAKFISDSGAICSVGSVFIFFAPRMISLLFNAAPAGICCGI
jgi:predicted dehydrogenase